MFPALEKLTVNGKFTQKWKVRLIDETNINAKDRLCFAKNLTLRFSSNLNICRARMRAQTEVTSLVRIPLPSHFGSFQERKKASHSS